MKKESTQFDFLKNEHSILELWETGKVFDKMVAKNADAKEHFRFLDGPITANASMAMHHVWGRSLKDAFIKYNTLRGRSCQYQNGFDAQGMWVEVEVEKMLGLNDKQAILKYGLGNFTEKCMERVRHFSNMQTRQSKRIGQIMDWDNSYFTNSDENITSIWHFLKKCYEKGYLAQSYKSMPWCPRCGTSLSEHEMSGSYKELTHKAVFVQFKLEADKIWGDLKSNVRMLVWTTTPWTLSSNVAIAVHPELDYCVVELKSTKDLIIVGKAALKVLKKDFVKVVRELKGADLVGMEYQPALKLAVQDFEHKIIAWNEVSAADGSGAVHIAPGCGAEDFELGKKLGLKQIVPIDEAGRFTEEFEYLKGIKTDECEKLIFDKLKANGTLYYVHDFTHNYPYCWRCKTNVVFKLVSGWDIKTEKVKPQLLKAVETVTWEPEFLKKSMINWLENMGDWNISRRRFYGLPLPIYPCDCGHITVIGSLEELAKLSSDDAVKNLPHLHRPYIDEIKIKCKCGKEVARVPDVGDCWLDAGIAPFSTKKYFTDKEFWKKNFPSEVVLEMKEQVRLWFYSMLFMSVVLERRAPYERVVGYSTVLGEDGKKVSKTDSNRKVTFDEQIEIYGADPVRYVFATANPVNDMRFGPTMVEEARRKLIAFWNSYVFFNTYAVIDKPDIANHKPQNLDVTDIWLVERLNQYIETCTNEYDGYKVHNVILATEKFIDDLSNFYIRVNRRRFWKGENGDDKLNAYWALYNAIKAICVVTAPITPFMSEYIWQGLVRDVEPNACEFVMLADFPKKIEYDGEKIKGIIEQVDFVKQIISLALRIRAAGQIKVKQPLRTMYIKTTGKQDLSLFIDIIKDEVNVKGIEIVQDEEKFNVPYLVVDFKKAGAVLKGDVQKLKDELASLSTDQMTETANKGTFKNYPSDFFVKKLGKRPEFSAETEDDTTVVLDTSLDIELMYECNIRELIRSIQVARQNANLDISARIVLGLKAKNDVLHQLILKNKQKICSEVLATEVVENVVGGVKVATEIEGAEIVITFKVV